MKQYTVCISFRDKTRRILTVTEAEAKTAGNINRLLFGKYPQSSISRILVFSNSQTAKRGGGKPFRFAEMTYHWQFEQWKEQRARIERENPEGHKDSTGYGSRTDGRRNRFYIGRSTGWTPIYLEILSNRSTGGASLFWKAGTFKRVA